MFLGKIGQKNVFCDILQRKNSFPGYKNKKLKKWKNWHFSKVVNPWFWCKNGYFSKLFFLQYRPRKCLVRYTKKLFSRLKKTKSTKSRKIDIFPKALTHGFGPKMDFSFTFFFLRNIGKENVFDDIQERKISFLGYKNKKLKKSKNWHFSKGVNPWFWSKNGHFSKLFFLGNIGNDNVFYDILERKNALLGYKNKKFKNWNIEVFPKGLTHGFGPKMVILPNLVFEAK